MKFDLPKLPFVDTDLEPHISAQTIAYHYGKHYQNYINKLNELIKGTEYEDMPLEDVLLNSVGAVYNNAAQVWNHTFYFFQFSGNARVMPRGDLSEAIDQSFGDYDAFKARFSEAVAALFGSGWVWLVRDAQGNLAIRQTVNALNPMTEGETPLLVCDVWEHAYYLDYQNRRPDYLCAFWEVLDWEAIEKRYHIA